MIAADAFLAPRLSDPAQVTTTAECFAVPREHHRTNGAVVPAGEERLTHLRGEDLERLGPR